MKEFTKYNVLIAGTGGTGGWFIPLLSHFANNFHRKELTITLFDDDVVEEKNIKRQNFNIQDIGKNKAEVFANRYDIFPLNVVTEKMTSSLLDMMYMSDDENTCNLIIGCTDSKNFRKEIINYLYNLDQSYYNWIYIDSGNDKLSGQIIVDCSENLKEDNIYNKDMFNLLEHFSSLPNDDPQEQQEEGCENMDQSLMINNLMGCYLYNIVNELISTDKLSINSLTARRYQLRAEFDINRAISNQAF